MTGKILVAPLEVILDPELGDPERRVLLALFSFRDRATNTVWPSLESIAERAQLRDRTRVSKITASLADKGWLTKKKRGFSGCNEYSLQLPDRLSNLGSESNFDGDTKSNLDSESKCNEQTIEQITTPKRFKPPTLEEVIEYVQLMGYTFNPHKFHAHYSSNGWKVGRNPMKDWKQACITWQTQETDNAQHQRGTRAHQNQRGLSAVDRVKRRRAEAAARHS